LIKKCYIIMPPTYLRSSDDQPTPTPKPVALKVAHISCLTADGLSLSTELAAHQAPTAWFGRGYKPHGGPPIVAMRLPPEFPRNSLEA
jgi:hypothetical protein